MNTYETINDILVHLFNEIWELEKNAIMTEAAAGRGGKKNEDHSRLTYDGNECTGQ